MAPRRVTARRGGARDDTAPDRHPRDANRRALRACGLSSPTTTSGSSRPIQP